MSTAPAIQPPPAIVARPRPRARVALAHDWLCGYRGGEAVLDRIARVVAHGHEIAGLYLMFDDRRPITPAIDGLPHSVSVLDRLDRGAGGRARRWLLPLYPAAVRELSRRLAREHAERPIDLLISTSSAAIKGLRPPPGVPHLCYCHGPARYVWSRTSEYGPAWTPRGLGLRLAAAPFRAWDRRTSGRVSRFLANSSYVAAEVERCYGRSAAVVHPPVRTAHFTPDPRVERGGHWLLVSALEPYKRADVAISAAAAAGRELVIVGGGSEGRRLERLARRVAPGLVRFAGRVADDELRDHYRRAALLVFPQVEDFGIVAVEAQACGLPVVARRAGGALDTVIDGVTGAFFDGDSPDALAAAAARAPSDPAACRANAERFSEEAFDAALRRELAAILAPLRTAPRMDDERGS